MKTLLIILELLPFLTFLFVSGVTSLEHVKVGGFIFFRDIHGKIEYLLLQKARNGKWNIPKGRLDDGESMMQGATRETQEETGYVYGKDYLAKKSMKVNLKFENNKDEFIQVKAVPAMLINLDKPVLLSKEHSDYAWLSFHKALGKIQNGYQDLLIKGNELIQDARENHIEIFPGIVLSVQNR